MSANRFAEQLFTQYQTLWYRIAHQYVGNPQDAQDVVQESYRKFLSIEREWTSFEDAKRYFSTVLVHTSVDFYKSAKKKQENPLPEGDGSMDSLSDSAAWRRPWKKEEEEREETILENSLEIIAELPWEQRVAIERLYLAEKPCSLTELGQELHLPLSTLKSRALLGIEKIKKTLRKKRLL